MVAANYRITILLTLNAGIPRLSVLHHDKARRLITLIDEAYDAGVRFHWTAASAPQTLFVDLSKEILKAEVQHGVLASEQAWETDVHARPLQNCHRAAEMKKISCIETI